ncbi:MAG: methyltransferase domain-containing protein [Variovorax sp.]
MPRRVEPEMLDELAQEDPAAQRSRRDLQRIHRAMGTASILRRAFGKLPTSSQHGDGHSRRLRVLELGAGDGTLLVGVARARLPAWQAVDLTLLDRQHLLDEETVARYAAQGWSARAQVVDVMAWARDAHEAHGEARRWDLIVANLFLHHFEAPALTLLLRAIASRTDHFIACEPRRSRVALAGSHLVGVIGANAVTRQDAVLSVRAGFRGQELTQLWSALGLAGWSLSEGPAGLFSHCFCASRRAPDSADR